jgi:hypothetical protein
MKTFSGGKLLSPATARNCFFVNQFATPGLGSLMGGKILAGIGQLLLALLGFGLLMVWFLQTIKAYYSLADEDAPELTHVSYARYFFAGALFFGASWLWSLYTSISLIRSAKVPEPLPPGSIPPRITK